MLEKIKETLKDWILAHEKLYWFIIFGLAFTGFLLVTMFGLAKLEKANASEAYTIPWAGGEKTFNLDNEKYYLYTVVETTTETYYYLALSNMPFIYYESGINGFITLPTGGSGTFYYYTDYYDNRTSDVYGTAVLSSSVASGTKSFVGEVFTNCDIVDKSGNVVFYSNPLRSEPVYSGSEPYLRFNKRTWLNRFFMDENWDFNESFFKFTFDLANVSSEEFESREVSFSGYITLPSKAQFDEIWNVINTSVSPLSAKERLEKYYYYYSGEYYPYWLKYLDRTTVDVGKKWYITFTVDCPADSLEINLSHEYLIDLIESCNAVDLETYYDLEQRGELINILKSYIWVSRLDSIVSTTYADTVKYGNLVSFAFSSSLSEPVVVVGNSDPLTYGPPVDFVGPMLPDSDVQQNIEQAYKDALEEAKKENESLYGEMEGYYDVQGAFGDLSGSDLWTSFRSLADGLASMAPSVRAIASLSGAVLAFIPLQVTGMISFTLVALCIIAIIKAIRG